MVEVGLNVQVCLCVRYQESKKYCRNKENAAINQIC